MLTTKKQAQLCSIVRGHEYFTFSTPAFLQYAQKRRVNQAAEMSQFTQTAEL